MYREMPKSKPIIKIIIPCAILFKFSKFLQTGYAQKGVALPTVRAFKGILMSARPEEFFWTSITTPVWTGTATLRPHLVGVFQDSLHFLVLQQE